MTRRSAGHGDHRGDVPRQQTGTGSRTISRIDSSTSASVNHTPSHLPPVNAKPASRPIVDIYSTFLQRSYDQIFQEVALQDLPVVFMLDRAGLTGPDGPTHHGAVRHRLHAVVSKHGLHGTGYADEVGTDAGCGDRPHASDQHSLSQRHRHWNSIVSPEPIEIGKSEVIREGTDGTIVAFGAMLDKHIAAAELLAWRTGCRRHQRPFCQTDRCAKWFDSHSSDGRFVVTVEEGAKMGGFGSAFLECCRCRTTRYSIGTDAGLARRIHRSRRSGRSAG